MDREESSGAGIGTVIAIGLVVLTLVGGVLGLWFFRAEAQLTAVRQLAIEAEVRARRGSEIARERAEQAAVAETELAAGELRASHHESGTLLVAADCWVFVRHEPKGLPSGMVVGWEIPPPTIEAAVLTLGSTAEGTTAIALEDPSTLRIYTADAGPIDRYALPAAALRGIVERIEAEERPLRELILEWTGAASPAAWTAPDDGNANGE
jgi:hypothetical protein